MLDAELRAAVTRLQQQLATDRQVSGYWRERELEHGALSTVEGYLGSLADHLGMATEPTPPEWDEHGGIPDNLAGLAARQDAAHPNPYVTAAMADHAAQVATGAPTIRDELAARSAHRNVHPDDLVDWPATAEARAARIADLEGTVSGLRAELAATLRRLEDTELRNRNGERTLEVERHALERQAAALRDLESNLDDAVANRDHWMGVAEAYQETARQAADRLSDLERVLAGNMPEPPAADAPYPLDAAPHPQVPLPQRVVATRWDVTMPDDERLDRPFMARAELLGQRWRLEVAWQPDSWQRMGHLGVMPEGTTSWQAREAVVEAAQRSRQYAMDHRTLDDSAQAALWAVVQPTTDDD